MRKTNELFSRKPIGNKIMTLLPRLDALSARLSEANKKDGLLLAEALKTLRESNQMVQKQFEVKPITTDVIKAVGSGFSKIQACLSQLDTIWKLDSFSGEDKKILSEIYSDLAAYLYVLEPDALTTKRLFEKAKELDPDNNKAREYLDTIEFSQRGAARLE